MAVDSTGSPITPTTQAKNALPRAKIQDVGTGIGTVGTGAGTGTTSPPIGTGTGAGAGAGGVGGPVTGGASSPGAGTGAGTDLGIGSTVPSGPGIVGNPYGTFGSPTAGGGSSSTGTPAAGGGSTNPLSNLLSGLGNNAGTTAEYAALAALGESQAATAKNELTNNANTLSSLGQPAYNAGTGQLAQTTAASPGINAGLLGNASTEINAAGQGLSAYQTGNVTPAQQALIDQQTAAQKQAIMQQFASAGATGSSAELSQLQQVDNNALAQTNQFLNSDLANAQALQTQAQTTFGTILSQSLQQITTGIQPIEAAIQTLIAGDAAISTSLEQFFGALGEGYGKAVGGGTSSTPAQSKPSTGGGPSAGGGGTSAGGGGGGSRGGGGGGGGGGSPGTAPSTPPAGPGTGTDVNPNPTPGDPNTPVVGTGGGTDLGLGPGSTPTPQTGVGTGTGGGYIGGGTFGTMFIGS